MASTSTSVSRESSPSLLVGAGTDLPTCPSDSEIYLSPAASSLEGNMSPVNSLISLSSHFSEVSATAYSQPDISDTIDASVISLSSNHSDTSTCAVASEVSGDLQSELYAAESSSDDSTSDTESLVPCSKDETPTPEGNPHPNSKTVREDKGEQGSEILPAMPMKLNMVATLLELTANQRSQHQLLQDVAAFPEKYLQKFRDIEQIIPCNNVLWRKLMDDVDAKIEESGLTPLADVSYSFLATNYPDAHKVIQECTKTIVGKIGGWYQETFESRLPAKLEYADENSGTGDLAAVLNQLRSVALDHRRNSLIMMIPRFRRKGEAMRDFCERFMRNTYPRVPALIQEKWLNEAAPVLVGNALTRHYSYLANKYMRRFGELPFVTTPERFVDVVCVLCRRI